MFKQPNYSRSVPTVFNHHTQRNQVSNTDNLIFDLLNTAINRDSKNGNHRSFLKRKTNGDLQITKVVNNVLRSTVVVTYVPSILNQQKTVSVFFKRYRMNTVEKFGQSCRETHESIYNLLDIEDSFRFVQDVQKHMAVVPENLKTINEALPVRMSNFSSIEKDTLYAFEIHAFDIVTNSEPLGGMIEMTLVSDKMTKDFSIKISDIISFNNISDLIGKWVVLNYKGAFKIKTKDEIYSSYNVLEKT